MWSQDKSHFFHLVLSSTFHSDFSVFCRFPEALKVMRQQIKLYEQVENFQMMFKVFFFFIINWCLFFNFKCYEQPSSLLTPLTLQPFHLWDLIVNSLRIWLSIKEHPIFGTLPSPPPFHPICLKLHLYGREKFLFGSCVWEWLFYCLESDYCLRNQTMPVLSLFFHSFCVFGETLSTLKSIYLQDTKSS